MGVIARGQVTVHIAEKGESPVMWSLVPTPTSVGRSEAGVCAPASASCRLRLTVGSESEIVGVDKPIEYRGRNLLLKSNTQSTVVPNNPCNYPYAAPLVEGKTYTIVVCGRYNGTDPAGYLGVYYDGGWSGVGTRRDAVDTISTTTFVYKKAAEKPMISFYHMPNGNGGTSTVQWAILVKGNKAPRLWSPAPEDYALSLNGNPYTAGANYAIKPTDTELLWAGALAGASIDPVRVSIIKDGATGERGIKGDKGADGTQYYTWIRYSDNANGVPNDNDSTRPYIGIAVNKLTATESDIASDYRWSKITGDKGIKGDKGADGKQLYTWMKYADTAQGSGLSDSAVGKSYIGFAYNKPTATESTTPSDYMWSKIKGDVGDSVTGKMLFRDPEFRQGANQCMEYDNTGSGKVTLSRIPKPADCPTTSTHCLEVRVTGKVEPGHGGFGQYLQSRANAVFFQKIVAKVPVGYELYGTSNAMGDGYTDAFITPKVGTGRYETYLRKIVCGTTGIFHDGGYIHLKGGVTPTPANPLVWQIASCTAYDLTDSEKYDEAIEQVQADTDRANAQLAEIASDSKLSPVEKQQIAIEWGRIQAEHAKNTATATTLRLTTGEVVIAFNTLNGYITPLLANLSVTSDINGSTLRSTFGAWYEKNVALVNAISKANADKATDEIDIGTRNLLLKSNTLLTGSMYNLGNYSYATPLVEGETYTIVVCGRYNGTDPAGFLGVYYDGGHHGLGIRRDAVDTINTTTFVYKKAAEKPMISFYHSPNGNGGTSTVQWAILVKGNKAPRSWVAAPEDTDEAILLAKNIGLKAMEAADASLRKIVDVRDLAGMAMETADNATMRLEEWANDRLISPAEKTGLKQQQVNIASEYTEITANATRYGVAYTAYTTAYNAAYSALTKYTAATPECIPVTADYANIADYYTARKTILEAVAVAIKTLQDATTAGITTATTQTKNTLAKELGYADYAAMQAAAAEGNTIINGGHIRTSLLDADQIIAKNVDVVNGTDRVKLTPENGMEMLENNVQTATYSGKQIRAIYDVIPKADNIAITEQSLILTNANLPTPALMSKQMAAGSIPHTAVDLTVDIPAVTLYCDVSCGSHDIRPPEALTCKVGLEFNGTTQWMEFTANDFSVIRDPSGVVTGYSLRQSQQRTIPQQSTIVTAIVPGSTIRPLPEPVSVNLKYQFTGTVGAEQWHVTLYAKFADSPKADAPTTRFLKIAGVSYNAAFYGNGALFSKAIDQYVGMVATPTGTEFVVRSGQYGLRVDNTGIYNLTEESRWESYGLLCAYRVDAFGKFINKFGLKHSTINRCAKNSTGRYQLDHNIGHEDYVVQVTPSVGGLYLSTVSNHTAESVLIEFQNAAGVFVNIPFYVTIFGRY